MSDQDGHTVRQIGANIRDHLAQMYRSHPHLGQRISTRMIAEVSAHIAEVHGNRTAAEVLYQAGDRIAGSKGLVEIMPKEPDRTPARPEITFDMADETITITGLPLDEAARRLRNGAKDLERQHAAQLTRWPLVQWWLRRGWNSRYADVALGFVMGMGLFIK